jgi:hypothetical protein
VEIRSAFVGSPTWSAPVRGSRCLIQATSVRSALLPSKRSLGSLLSTLSPQRRRILPVASANNRNHQIAGRRLDMLHGTPGSVISNTKARSFDLRMTDTPSRMNATTPDVPFGFRHCGTQAIFVHCESQTFDRKQAAGRMARKTRH